MGCASSKGDINDQHPNIFQVMNVDDQFRPISPGQIEITDTELIFYQRAKQPTTWSLRNLRKYGFDSEIFSFECGRRCATGEGIFAFKCKKAEQLFNLLQHNIQVRNMSEEMGHELANTATTATVTAGNPNQREIQRRSTPEGYLNPVSNGRPPLSRPGSITSNGPTTPPPLAQNVAVQENNNNKSASAIRQSSTEHSYLNSEAILEASNPQYINLPNGDAREPSQSATTGAGARNLYMNIDTSQGTPVKPVLSVIIPEVARESDDEKNVNETVVLPALPTAQECQTCLEEMHCYANIDANALSAISEEPLSMGANGVVGSGMGMGMGYNFVIGSMSVPPTPTEVNYVELDLEPSAAPASKPRPLSDSPIKGGKPYVTIDFKKTDALSYSINPRLDLEEGCRKTRHNSTIGGDIRHSSSISD